ncbi:L,D-transpeptidase [Oryzibacter oryziterrae]|uniref:L,D-transpeptidase n=1 Tax=Oryzibacter oryziterrae TaxID=2766474 RepID=UPI001F4598EF|nr:L,D-transpeptidase [Oryzibacter oryziterrae]
MIDFPKAKSIAFVLAVGLSMAGCVTNGTKLALTGTSTDTASTHNKLDDDLSGQQIPPKDFQRATVDYATKEAPGTIIIDTKEKHLYLVEDGGKAIRYGVGVGREGFGWKGTVAVGSKQEWPRWFPPKEMIAREHARGHMIPDMMEGQIGNPLGARAMYLYDHGKDTLFRIHGTFEPNSIGTNASSGCIRMANYDVIDLYDRVKVGTKVVVQ